MDGNRKTSTAEGNYQKPKDMNDYYLGKIIEVHLSALDDLVTVNSLFLIAVFIGLSFASPNQQSLDNRRECDPNHVLAKTLVMYEVLSFSLFLVSSLAAKALKVLLNIYKLTEEYEIEIQLEFGLTLLTKVFHSALWRGLIMSISIVASALGVSFLTLSMVYVIQIRLGKLSCGSAYTLKSVTSLTVLVLFAFMLYLPPMFYAAFANYKINKKAPPTTDHNPHIISLMGDS